MECVEAWVKNTYLGFRIPYTVGDENKEYMPTFIVRVKGINLIVECQDFDADNSGRSAEGRLQGKNKDAKRHYRSSKAFMSAICLLCSSSVR